LGATTSFKVIASCHALRVGSEEALARVIELAEVPQLGRFRAYG